jgi:hypothetical protein
MVATKDMDPGAGVGAIAGWGRFAGGTKATRQLLA